MTHNRLQLCGLPKKMPVRGTLRSASALLRWNIRRATATFRATPDFLIIGAQKAGSSSLHDYLRQHPQLISSFTKEVHFFDGGLDLTRDQYSNGMNWYRAHFPLKVAVPDNASVFESSPLYLFLPDVPARVRALNPEMKMLILLRNPTDRAISHYFHERRKGREHLSLKDALEAESYRLARSFDTNDFRSEAFIHHSYKTRGIYEPQIRRWLTCFPRDQLHIIISEQLFQKPEITINKVFRFLNVDPDFQPKDLSARNVGGNKTMVDAEVSASLQEFFRPHNHALAKILGDISCWS